MKKLKTNEIHEVLFNAMCYVDDICTKNDIRYYLAYGTLLGAVREKDFIPWDPDIDLFMPREDYQKFCCIMEQESKDKYFLDNVENNPYSITPLEGRICIKGTLIRLGFKCEVPLRKEIRIDIAPLDFSSFDKAYTIKRNKKISIYQKLIYLKYIHVINKKRLISYAFHAVLQIVPYKLTLKRLLRLSENKHDVDTSRYICLTAAYTCNKRKPLRNEYPAKWFGEPELIMFHGREFPCPCDSHEFLRYFYGEDYMTPMQREQDGEYYFLDDYEAE